LTISTEILDFRDFQESRNRKPSYEEDSDTESIPEKNSLYCSACNFKITNENQKVPMRGKIEHTFMVTCFISAVLKRLLAAQLLELPPLNFLGSLALTGRLSVVPVAMSI
jgi:hypothetical protein